MAIIRTTVFFFLLTELVVKRLIVASMESLVALVARSNRISSARLAMSQEMESLGLRPQAHLPSLQRRTKESRINIPDMPISLEEDLTTQRDNSIDCGGYLSLCEYFLPSLGLAKTYIGKDY